MAKGDAMTTKLRTVWMNGHLLDESRAMLSPFDHGVLYGDGVFEGIRFYGRRPFRLGAHLDRLWRSAAALDLTIPFDRAELGRAMDELIGAGNDSDGYVRLVVTRGPGDLGIDPRSCPRPSVYLATAPVAMLGAADSRAGITAIVASTRQTPPDALDARIKSLNYLPRVLARLEARRAGADEAILLNHRGTVAEGSVDNLFTVQAGVVRTPPATDGALEGITRGAVLELARAAGIPVAEATLGAYDLITADELFLTGTAVEMVPVRAVDGRRIGAGVPGPIFSRLAGDFRRLIDHERG
jgi:branched-chain amino acid aminotransferase